MNSISYEEIKMNAKKESTLKVAEKAFAEAIAGNYPADLIARLYEDLKKEQRKVRR